MTKKSFLFHAGLTLASAYAMADAGTPSIEKPIDVKEPPFGEYDFTWLNGSNRQPASLLTTGPLTWSIYADVYYLYQFNQPIDHTDFPSTVAPRHDEISVNLASIGVDVTGLDGPIGRIYFQYGNNVETDTGQDSTTSRGFFTTHAAFNPIQQVAAGWHFHALHGVNTEFGIFPSYVGLESYLPQENWNYLRPFLSDFTPYYFQGSRNQIYFTQDLKLELWVVNGWQTLSQWHDTRAGGYILNWRPSGMLSISNAFYTGSDEQLDAGARRYYTDSSVQYKYFKNSALSLVADLGYESRTSSPGGILTGASLADRYEWNPRWATTLRADVYYDQTQALVLPLPGGGALPDSVDPFFGRGYTVTLDFIPSPWLIYRLEYMHRDASIPYFSGHSGISGPTGIAPGGVAVPGSDFATSDDRIVANVTLRL